MSIKKLHKSKYVIIPLAVFLAGCTETTEEAIVTLTPLPTVSTTVYEDFGTQMVNAGFDTVTITEYNGQSEEDSETYVKGSETSQTILVFNENGYRSVETVYSLEDGEAVFSYSYVYTYNENNEVTAVASESESGKILSESIKQEDGTWKDYNSSGEETGTTSRDSFGNITTTTAEDGSTSVYVYNINGEITSITYYDSAGNVTGSVLYEYYSNDHLPDLYEEFAADGSVVKLVSLVRGTLKDNETYSTYMTEEDGIIKDETDTYDEETGLLVSCIVHDTESGEYVTREYTYSRGIEE